MAKVHAFVAGPIEEVQKVAIALLDACETSKIDVEGEDNGKDIEVRYENGKITISYVPDADLAKWRSSEE